MPGFILPVTASRSPSAVSLKARFAGPFFLERMSRVLFAKCVAYAHRLELAAIVALSLLTTVVVAAERTVTWSNPTQYVDGTALPASDIERTTVVWGPSAQQFTNSKVVNGSATSTVIDLPVGTHFVAARTTAQGTDSGLSNVAQVTIAQPAPNPPSNLTVQAGQQTAYQLIGTKDQFVLLPVGTVAEGTECDSSQSVLGHYVVPRESVAWYGSVKPQAVLARCS